MAEVECATCFEHGAAPCHARDSRGNVLLDRSWVHLQRHTHRRGDLHGSGVGLGVGVGLGLTLTLTLALTRVEHHWP